MSTVVSAVVVIVSVTRGETDDLFMFCSMILLAVLTVSLSDDFSTVFCSMILLAVLTVSLSDDFSTVFCSMVLLAVSTVSLSDISTSVSVFRLGDLLMGDSDDEEEDSILRSSVAPQTSPATPWDDEIVSE